MLTEDQVEGAFILYFAVDLALLALGIAVFIMYNNKAAKALGILTILTSCVAAIKFMDVLDWMYPVLKYLP